MVKKAFDSVSSSSVSAYIAGNPKAPCRSCKMDAGAMKTKPPKQAGKNMLSFKIHAKKGVVISILFSVFSNVAFN